MKKTTLFVFTLLLFSNLNTAKASQASKYTNQYMKEVQETIKSNWHPKKHEQHFVLIARFKLDFNGEIIGDINFDKNMEDPEIIQNAKKAIQDSVPFQAINKKFITRKPNIEFAFSYTNPEQTPKQTKYAKKYTSKVMKKIKKQWQPPEYEKSYLLIAKFKLNFNGEVIEEIKFNQEVNDNKVMQSAKDAILKAAPFKTIDQKLMTKEPEISYYFRYINENEVDDDGDLEIQILRRRR